jgi:protein-S-isoprenylcysteine O-methyltransferase Ste14
VAVIRSCSTETVLTHKGDRFDTRQPVPLYLSFSLLQLGVACWLNSLWLLVSLIPALALMSLVVISREEHYLETCFPSDYLPYRASVRRWL